MKRTELKRKPAKPKKRPANPCTWSSRCKRRAPIEVTDSERFCKSHAAIVADTVVGTWVKYVRDAAGCVSCGSEESPQWAHIRSRGAHPSLHWYVGRHTETPGNSCRLCQSCHFKFTQQPAQWDVFVERRWPGLWTQLVHLEIAREQAGAKVDMAGIIREFRARNAEAA